MLLTALEDEGLSHFPSISVFKTGALKLTATRKLAN